MVCDPIVKSSRSWPSRRIAKSEPLYCKVMAGNFHSPTYQGRRFAASSAFHRCYLNLVAIFGFGLFNFRTFVSSNVNANSKHEGLERCSKYSTHSWLSLNFRPVATSQEALFATKATFLSSHRESEAAISSWRVLSERGHYMLIRHVPDTIRGNDPHSDMLYDSEKRQ